MTDDNGNVVVGWKEVCISKESDNNTTLVFENK